MPQAPLLFEPLALRGLTLRNRIVLSPMLTYAAERGHVTDWHLMHLGKFAAGGTGLVFMESTKVDPRGCTTPRDPGLWKDEFIPGLERITRFVKGHGAAIGLQLGHSGRKARNSVPWEGRAPLASHPGLDDGAEWELVAPSAIAASPAAAVPRALSIPEIQDMVACWGAAASRAHRAGFDVLEVHGAHGYLLHQFLSPAANRREDRYGGSPENRMRFAVEVVEEVRRHWPAEKPLFFRVSAIDEDGGSIEETVALCRVLRAKGVDVIDCSSGGMTPRSIVDPADRPGYGYQVPHAARVRAEAGIASMAVGLIVHADQAEAILQQGSADLVAIGREMLHNPNWSLDAAQKLGVGNAFAAIPPAYGYWLEKRDSAGFGGRPSTWQAGIEPARAP
ncbi:NADH:flavin oxidoreductase/NADH oxidase [Roseomonas sp. SSH11]|uniref:NADH:flavin oxidoreductase/NADH oxidase n=1 Tax=Pararoseomonas baculiformis TaxID=2820812 RepID=A0ABS4A934_9PROT|nr:NADH:flavin oxidoreductase/NADH oxidase [Pararoseomonas baculiformis]MBP0443506.1 NADH:flavin oxidoreductase/NADH oxidase [Pararoseomonas baculiformis]